MQNFDLKVNDRIEVVTEAKSYRSLIIDKNDDFILINLPVNNGEYLMLHTGESVEMNLYSEEGRCFNFLGDLISKGKDGNVLYYKLTIPYNIKKIQRRNFFRVDIVNFVEYKKITKALDEEISSIPYEKSLMVDLSGGGIKLKLNGNVKKKDILLVKIQVKGQDLVLKGEAVRVESTADKEKLCGIRFIDITESQSDIIIEELFEIMRKQRAKS